MAIAAAVKKQVDPEQQKKEGKEVSGMKEKKVKTPEQRAKEKQVLKQKKIEERKIKDQLKSAEFGKGQEDAEKIERQKKLNDIYGAKDVDGDGLITSKDRNLIDSLNLANDLNKQIANSIEDLAELEASVTFRGNSGDSGGDDSADIDAQIDAEIEQELSAEASADVGNITDLTSAMETQSMVEVMDRKELLELIGLTKEYFKQLLERNPEEMRQAHAAIQSAVAIYLTQLLTELSESEEGLLEEEEEEENRIKSNIKSSLDTAAQQINELSNQVNSSNQKRTKKKSKYLANLYEVPLLKALMKGDAVKRQTVWKALDQHLEKQIEKEEVKEEMFRYSF